MKLKFKKRPRVVRGEPTRDDLEHLWLFRQSTVDRIVDYCMEGSPAGRYVLITGKGGVGKSFLVKRILAEIHKREEKRGRKVILLEVPSKRRLKTEAVMESFADIMQSKLPPSRKLLSHLLQETAKAKSERIQTIKTTLDFVAKVEGIGGGYKKEVEQVLKQLPEKPSYDVYIGKVRRILQSMAGGRKTSWERFVDFVLDREPLRVVIAFDEVRTLKAAEELSDLLSVSNVTFFLVSTMDFHHEWCSRKEIESEKPLSWFEDEYIPCLWDARELCKEHLDERSTKELPFYDDFVRYLSLVGRGSPDTMARELEKCAKRGLPNEREVRICARLCQSIERHESDFEEIYPLEIHEYKEEKRDRLKLATYSLASWIAGKSESGFRKTDIERRAIIKDDVRNWLVPRGDMDGSTHRFKSETIAKKVLDTLLAALVKDGLLGREGDFYWIAETRFERQKKCPRCGILNEMGARFCEQCGLEFLGQGE